MKRILNIFLLLLFAFSADAQIVKSMGIKGGTSIANEIWPNYLTNSSKMQSRVGIYGVLSGEFFNSKYCSFVTDLGYCQKGSKKPLTSYQDPGQNTPTYYPPYVIKLNYFEYDALLKIRLEKKHFISYLLTGLRMDYQIYSEEPTNFFSYYIQKYGNRILYGFTIGAGVEYRIKKIGIHTEFQYQHDFSYVLNLPYYTYNNMEITNKAIIGNVGIKYYFPEKENSKTNNFFSTINGKAKSVSLKIGPSFTKQIISDSTFTLSSSNDSIILNIDNNKTRNGYYGALSLELLDSKNFSIIADLGYCTKEGISYIITYYESYYNPISGSQNGYYLYYPFRNSSNYLVLESLIKSRITISHFEPYALLGLKCDYLISFATNPLDYVERYTQRTKFIWGLSAGSGVEYKINKIGINAEVKYQHDFGYAISHSPFGASPFKLTNRTFIFNIGIKYYFQKKENQKTNQNENKN